MITVPYVTAAEFRAHPTFLDTNNLRTANSQAAQDSALNNALLTASQWCDDEIDMPLAAHVRVEQARVRPDRQGRLRYHPEHAPVLSVTSVATGPTPALLSSQGSPQVWIEQDGRILVAYLTGTAGLGALQFGAPAAALDELLVQWTYVAGFPHTQLAAPAATGTSLITVRDPTGIVAGTVLRLWTPALEEAVTVASVAGAAVALTGPLANAHPIGMSITALPTTARQAVVSAAIAQLLRPSPAAESATPPGAPSPSSSSRDSARTSGAGGRYLTEARGLLDPFRRIR